MEKIVYLWDPRTPWCHATTRWIERLAQLGAVELEWGLFSIELVNLKEHEDPHTFRAQYGPIHRTASLVRDRHGKEAMGRFCSAVGHLMWELDVPEEWVERAVPAPSIHETARDALVDAGLDPMTVDDAMADPATWEAVIAEFEHWRTLHVFGVGTLVFGGGEGPAVFGPVVGPLSDDATVLEIWEHVAGIVNLGYCFELKRYRAPGDSATVELPGARLRGALRGANLREARRRIREPASPYANASPDFVIAEIYHEKEAARESV
jgi:hypothetical protein